jgi:hypothetical protein
MVNFSFNLASVSGIILAVGGAALYAVRSARPELSRDHDIFFSAVGLLCGLILIFYGWRFDPIMQFGQVLLTGAAIFFVIENLRLRRVSTEQAKKNTPIVDRERPVSREVRADFEDYGAFEDRNSSRRIPERRRTIDDFEEERPRRSRSNEPRLTPAEDRPRRPRSPRSEDVFSSESNMDDWSGGRAASARNLPPRDEARPKRRPSEKRPRSNSTEYVDFRPVEPDNERDNWGE